MEKSVADLWYEEAVEPRSYVLSKKGYAILYVPDCPLAWKSKKLARCRYVAWAMGWLTSREQVVHHKDYDKLNDRPSNLQVVTGIEHEIIHHVRPPGTGDKISAALKGHVVPQELRKQISATLKRRYAAGELKVVVTDEQKEKIRQKRLGWKWSDEMKEHLSEVHKGKTLSAKAREKLSEANKGRTITWGDKLSKALKGRRPSDACLAAKAAARHGKPLTDEHRRKVSESLKSYRASLPNVHAERDARIAEMRSQGKTLQVIGLEVGLSIGSIHRILAKSKG